MAKKGKWYDIYQCSHCYNKAKHRRLYGKGHREYFCNECWEDEKDYHDRNEEQQYFYDC